MTVAGTYELRCERCPWIGEGEAKDVSTWISVIYQGRCPKCGTVAYSHVEASP